MNKIVKPPTKVRKIYKYGTGHTIPEGAIYLSTQIENVGNVFVWHYFLVEVEENE